MTIKETKGNIVIDANVNLSKKSIVKYQCAYCGRTYKAKYTYNRHHKRGCKKKPADADDIPAPREVCEDEDDDGEIDFTKTTKKENQENQKEEEEEEYEEEEEEKTKDELREEVMVLYRNDPTALMTECDNDIIKKVNGMGRQELKLKIAQKRLLIGAKLNGSMTNTMLLTANKIIGGLLQCQEEMNTTTMNDDVLRESCDDLLSYYLLDSIPITARLGLLYGSHIVSNTFRATQRRQNEIVIIPVEEKKPEPKPIFKKKPINCISEMKKLDDMMVIQPDEGENEDADEPPTIINN